MHNAKFDLAWMIEHSPSPEGQISARNIQDTMLKSQLLHDYRTKSGAAKAGRPDAWKPNDLQSVLSEFLGEDISKSIHHEDVYEEDPATKELVLKHKGVDWTGPWSDEMIDYMLEDIVFLAELDEELDVRLQLSGQQRASWIEQNAVFATAWMTVNGVRPDLSGWRQANEDWKHQHHAVLQDLLQLWPGVENYNSPKQLVESSVAAFGGIKLPNTKKATLKQWAPTVPGVAKLLEQRHWATRLKNWGPHYLKNFVCGYQDCGRFHPGWNQIGTETSRPSCSRPNLLQIPRADDFRRLFIPDPGHVIASLDYSAIEVLVAAVYANEKNLIKACATGDPHLETARMIAGDPTITKSDPRRQSAKIANFGLLFGGGLDGLITQARDLFDTIMSPGEGAKMMAQYFRLYPGLLETKNKAYEAMAQKEDRLVVENMVGFRRYLEGYNRKPTSYLNTYIQSTAAFGMKSSFRRINEAGLTPYILGQVYDEVLFEFPEERAEEFTAQARECMIGGMQEVLGLSVPVTVEPNVGLWWQ